jgi:hypothetical protein
MAKRFEERRLHPLFSSERSYAVIGRLQSGVDPPDEITVANVTDKEKQAVGCDIQRPFPKRMFRQRARRLKRWLGACFGTLPVTASVTAPLATQPRTKRRRA